MRFSRRFASWNLEANQLTEALAARKSAGAEVLDLTESNPTRAGLAYPEEAIRAAMGHAGAMRYRPDPLGLRAAREAVSNYYSSRGVVVEPERVVLTASSSEAYGWLFKLLCNPGDEVACPRPSYPLFEYLAGLEFIRLIHYECSESGGRWTIDTDSIRLAAGPRTRAIIAVHPNNPTGHCVSCPERDWLAGFAGAREIPLIVDEVFQDFVYREDSASQPSFAAEREILTFTLNGLSKTAALPQLKLGWIVVSGPAALAEAALNRLELIADTYLSVSTPVQLAAETLLTEVAPRMRRQILDRAGKNLRTLERTLAATSRFRLLTPEGGWSVLVETPFAVDEAFCLDLLETTGVLLHPSEFFGFAEPRYAVLSLLTPPPVFEEGVTRMATHMTSHH